MEIYFKDRVASIHKWFSLNLWKFYWMKSPQICEITAVINVVIWTINFLNPKKFPQTASWRLDLFSCLIKIKAILEGGNLKIWTHLISNCGFFFISVTDSPVPFGLFPLFLISFCVVQPSSWIYFDILRTYSIPASRHLSSYWVLFFAITLLFINVLFSWVREA